MMPNRAATASDMEKTMDRDDIYAGADLTPHEIDAAKAHLQNHAREDGTLGGSYSYLQRKMFIPYSHAIRLVEYLEAEGFVTERKADGTRKLITS
jgi:DNA segregation ATPase FtsK/SpoIIIE-like protein